MMPKQLVVAIALTLGFVGAIQATEPRSFELFEISNHDNPSLRYQFSRAAATSDDPVVIAAVGREFKKSDRENRVDLQKVWLQHNVPKKMKLVSRFLVTECGRKHHGKWDACDVYTFADSKGTRVDYYIYVGNWPD